MPIDATRPRRPTVGRLPPRPRETDPLNGYVSLSADAVAKLDLPIIERYLAENRRRLKAATERIHALQTTRRELQAERERLRERLFQLGAERPKGVRDGGSG